jgi:cellulose synthase operon protein C
VAALALLAVVLALLAARAPALRLLARRDVDQARVQVAAGRIEDGRALLHRALRRFPGLADARQALGELELGAGRIESAFLQFQAATELVPLDPRGWLGLARVRDAAGQPAETAAALDEVLQLDPTQVDARAMRAQVRLELGHDQGALLDAGEASRQRPTDPRIWLVLVRATARVKGAAAGAAIAEAAPTAVAPDLLTELAALRSGQVNRPRTRDRVRDSGADHAERWPGALGVMMRDCVGKIGRQDWDGAEALAANAGNAYPETLIGPWLAGVLSLARQRVDPAERLFREALVVSPRSHRPVTNLVGVWSGQGGPLRAGDQLLALARAEAGFVYPLPIAAHAYLEADQPAKAESTARLAITMLPGSPVPYRDVAILYLELDRAGEALSLCDEGLARFPGDVPLQLLRARAALLLGDRERAIQQYEQLLPRWPDHPIVAAELAALLVEARADARSRARALQLVHEVELDGPMEPDVLGAMGRVYLVAGDATRALAVLEPAAQAAPADPGLHYQLALALRAVGRTDEALREVRRSLGSGHPFLTEPDARRLLRELGGER